MSGSSQRVEWEALGTSVVLCVTEAEALEQARASVERELAQIDVTCSRFRADSELSRLNASSGRATRVSPLLAEALELALAAARLTGGAVDPTLGRSLELCGYDRDWRLLPEPRGEPQPPVVEARRRSGWQTLQFDAASLIVRVPRGVSLDLGATAKAWAADRAARAAYSSTRSGVLLSLGGDVVAVGPAPAPGWQVRVTDDHRSEPSAPGQTITIRSGGLASSSTAVRRWSHGGKTMHHLLDPQTGLPARTPWRTVSVAAADCVQANIAATAALLRGDRAPAWLGQLQLPARLVANDGRSTTVGLWPEPVAQREGKGEQ
ncbi:MAG TPA: FAD:protein FMN transferase [Solirubrobacteraceae bacterium]|jgi:thiamine biosynthesis lipoprotein